ncbi:hypothetical protein CLUG_00688 [Clavispora lusitaniae ATCC 42720]|uniref:Uncharacterized protein n=1 Tax=Clavispora lusitaniae (strain ATCC 42720) TaxID=306902 RepID=C4XXL6_CLAL4|nr:uncharacterized protein CLUG_00688 [Clavispora lusitaniae ATCC 42720]EEQ36565.1 hypothetical protein CLUG_00688 [Clavispora lusitaniae ATCC 42720]KAF5212965.1 hypothetical protein E0198_000478 [Clavispora lusitaniae]
MLRSQSVSYLSEKRKTGLFMSIRSRKSSIKDLSSIIGKPRPLSQSADTLLADNTVTKRKSMFVPSSVAENKENPEQARSSKIPADLKGKRKSMIFKSKTTNFSSEKTLTGVNSEPSDIISVETIPIDSPLSQKTKVESLDASPIGAMDYSIYLKDFVEKEEETSKPSKLHRTVNLTNFSDFKGDARLPMGNRLSMEVETKELEDLQRQLSRQDNVRVSMVENAIFLSFFRDQEDAQSQIEGRYWDKLDACVFKEEYNSDDKMYMYF